MGKHKVNNRLKKDKGYVLTLLLLLIVLLLSAFSLNLFFSESHSDQVLGATSEIGIDKAFWTEFLKSYPNYVPGWIEIGRSDIAKQIDPNFEI